MSRTSCLADTNLSSAQPVSVYFRWALIRVRRDCEVGLGSSSSPAFVLVPIIKTPGIRSVNL